MTTTLNNIPHTCEECLHPTCRRAGMTHQELYEMFLRIEESDPWTLEQNMEHADDMPCFMWFAY